MRVLTLLSLFAFIISDTTLAAPKKFKIGTDEFSIEPPEGWNVQRDFFFPVGIVSPDNPDQQRSVIGITPADFTDDIGAFENGDKDPKPFIEGREEWLAENDGKSISYDPYEKQTWKGIEAAHVLGHRYSLPSGTFYARSYYVLCNGGRLFHFKTLVSQKYESTHQDLVNRAVRTFQCLGKTVAKNGAGR